MQADSCVRIEGVAFISMTYILFRHRRQTVVGAQPLPLHRGLQTLLPVPHSSETSANVSRCIYASRCEYWPCSKQKSVSVCVDTTSCRFKCVGLHWRRDNVVREVTRLRAERSGLWIALETLDFSLLQNVRTGSGPHLACCSGIGFLPQGYSCRHLNWTTPLELALRLRMSGAIPVLPLYALMPRTEATLLCTLCVTFLWLLNDAVGIEASSCRATDELERCGM